MLVTHKQDGILPVQVIGARTCLEDPNTGIQMLSVSDEWKIAVHLRRLSFSLHSGNTHTGPADHTNEGWCHLPSAYAERGAAFSILEGELISTSLSGVTVVSVLEMSKRNQRGSLLSQGHTACRIVQYATSHKQTNKALGQVNL